MVRIEARYEGDLRCRAVHGPSETVVLTDAPTDNHGRGESFSPTDLVATALGTCMVTTMGIAAQKHGIAFEGSRVSVVKHMTAKPVRRIGRLDVHIDVVGEHTEAERDRLESAARGCPVAVSLGADVEVALEIQWAASAS